MMCSRSAPGLPIRASTRHYHPKRLLYATSSEHHWHGGDWGRVHQLLRGLAPEQLRDSLAALLTGPAREREAEALPIVEWIEQEGRTHGFRVPSAQERARATGQAAYLQQLMGHGVPAFTDRDLFDWTGSHFDPDAVVARVLDALREGRHRRARTFLDPPAILAGYYALRDTVASHPAIQQHPVPLDLLAAFQGVTSAAARAARQERRAEEGGRAQRPRQWARRR